MINRFLILSLLVAFSIFGCAFLPEGLMTLKRAGDSQKQISKYLTKQGKLFDKLLADVKRERLKPGISQKRVISAYGSPVLIKASRQPPVVEIFLYRRPTEYFNSEKVYLYFDQAAKLIHLEHELPNQEK